MSSLFKVSVIIPVYNAEQYLETAVLSAITNSDVGEVILVEDGSPDGCLKICKKLQNSNHNVKLLQHANGENRGAGESRNLGIKNASCDYVSFLDADDYYLPNRFNECKKILLKDDNIDYVFGVSQYDNEHAIRSERFKRMMVTGQKKMDVFENLLVGKSGYFDTNSMTIRRESLLSLDKLFNPKLKLHQDSELWLRIAYHLIGKADGVVLPGSVVRQHENNRITHKNNDSIALFWTTVFKEFENLNLSRYQRNLITIRYSYFNRAKDCKSYLSLFYYKILFRTQLKINRFKYSN